MSQVGTTHDHPQALVHSMVLWLSFETGSGSAVTRSKGLWCATLSLLLRTKDEHQKKRAWKNRGPWALFLLEAGPHQSGLPPLYHRPTKRSFCPKEGNPCAVHPRVQRNGNSPVIVCTLDTASRQRACTFTIGIKSLMPRMFKRHCPVTSSEAQRTFFILSKLTHDFGEASFVTWLPRKRSPLGERSESKEWERLLTFVKSNLQKVKKAFKKKNTAIHEPNIVAIHEPKYKMKGCPAYV